MTRAVLDTNVWLGWIRWTGAAHEVVQRGIDREYTLVTSHEILHELVRVLRSVFGLDDAEAYEWYVRILSHFEVVKTTPSLNIITVDPTDNKFLECAVVSRSHHIISRDRHLLQLKAYLDIAIRTPQVFLDWWKEHRPSRVE